MRFSFTGAVFLYCALFFCCGPSLFAQRINDVVRVRLPDSMALGSREFSGLAASEGRLYFLGENRDDRLEAPTAGIHSISLDDLDESIRAEGKQVLQYRFHPVSGIDRIRQLNGYQGLEALAFLGDRFFITVETELHSDSCYLVTGRRQGDAFRIDTSGILALEKPLLTDGGKVFNASFEALALSGNSLYVFFEFNGFARNYAYRVDTRTLKTEKVPLDRKISFRVTDAVSFKRRLILGVNYFFPLKAEAIYQDAVEERDKLLVQSGNEGKWHPFARLVVLKAKRKKVKVKRYIPMPDEFWTSNWEGAALHKKGVLLVNDKFIKQGGHETQLIYLPLRRRWL